ncbi:MAG: class I SAM-dependent rRNA methyltransferase [Pseudomonadales bacterium]|nr:class I SAM-dependent rRNA methyltransferase [Pseudomonadales bacterium]
MSLPRLQINDRADKRLRNGHLWLYSNEVDNTATPLKQFSAGEQVRLENAKGKFIALATVNPQTLICARIFNREEHALDKSLLVHRLNQALALRERFYSRPFYRLVYAEGDYLPGLVVDRFGDYLSVQITSAGMERMKPAIIDALQQVLKPAGILFRHDASSREQEGLDKATNEIIGNIPETVELIENNTHFRVSLREGQKTGWFYDHRQNRHYLQALSKNKSVLDVFSYVGGWGIQALQAGASEATLIDSSASALDLAHHNARLNDCDNKLTCLEGSALEAMKALIEDKRKFDIVVMDPPAFIKRKKDLKKGEKAYHHYNQMALRLLKRDGLLVSASCSMHMKRNMLQDVVRTAGRHIDRQLQLIYQGGQGPDHPIHPAIEETDYLKAFIYRSL